MLSSAGLLVLRYLPTMAVLAVIALTLCLATALALLHGSYRSAFSVAICLFASSAVFISYGFTALNETRQKALLTGRTAEVTACVIEEPQLFEDAARYYVETEEIGIAGAPQKIKLYIYSQNKSISAFDRIRATVEFSELDGKYENMFFSEECYVAASASGIKNLGQSESFRPYKYAVVLRVAVRRSITERLSEGTRGILAGFIIGGNDLLDSETADAFTKCGVLHMIAVSGMHMSVLCTALGAVLNALCIRRRFRVFIITPFLIVYTALSGFSPSSIRAVIMTAAALSAAMLKRRADSLTLLGAAALVMLTVKPNMLFGISFQLSFSAMLGILILSPVVSRFTDGLVKVGGIFGTLLKYICSTALTSVCASVGAYPVQIASFGTVSNVAVLANVAISLAATLALVLGMLAAAADLTVGGALSGALYQVCELVLYYIRGAALLIARLPYSYGLYSSLPSIAMSAVAAAFIAFVYFSGREISAAKFLKAAGTTAAAMLTLQLAIMLI